MEAILEAEGFDIKHKAKGNYHSPFREDKDPSFHIDEANHRWFDHGSGEGGDVITLVQKLKGLTFTEALAYLEKFNPDLGISTVSASASSEAKTSTALSGYVNHSGGAYGSDTEWGNVGKKYGVESKHYYHGNKTPNGNTLVSEEDFNEGLEKVRQASITLGRVASKPFVLDLLGRNWMQVRNADAIFAVGNISTNIRHRLPDGVFYNEVEGGTGWAVQMAIDAGKPIFVFDINTNTWKQFDKSEQGCWKTLESAPVLTKNFAGIGTRKITSEGKEAIAAAYKATIQKLLKESAVDEFMKDVDTSKKINIWAGSNENALLSNMAIRPFVIEGKRFESVEQRFQYRKAVFFGDEVAAKQILGTDNPYEAKLWGRKVKGYDDAKWAEVAPKEMEAAIKLSFMANPQAAVELLNTGNALLTHNQETSVWKDEFPRILMRVRHNLQGNMISENGEYRSESTIEIREISKKITSKSLRRYEIEDRGIHPDILDKYCSQVKYTVEYQSAGQLKKMTYMAIGFPNRNGDWTLRGAPCAGNEKGIKRSTGMDYTVINEGGDFVMADQEHTPSKNVVVFEGFNDFLSWLSWRGQLEPVNTDVVVFNSTVNRAKAMDFITSHENVYTYLDNDKTGIKHTQIIEEECKKKDGVNFKDCSYFYAKKGLDDFNDAWKVEKAKRGDRVQIKSRTSRVGLTNVITVNAPKPQKKTSHPGKL